jgi:hypothetical protein
MGFPSPHLWVLILPHAPSGRLYIQPNIVGSAKTWMCHTAQKTSSKEPFRPSETLSVYRKSQCCICDSGNMDALLGPNPTTIMDRSVKTVDGIHLQNFIEFLKPRFLACTSGYSSLSCHFIAHSLFPVMNPSMSLKSTHMVWFFIGRDQLRQSLTSWPLIKVTLVRTSC